ncbi:MAG: carbohydrate ABC transporter permease [Candidatus Limnocylindria bacterium]
MERIPQVAAAVIGVPLALAAYILLVERGLTLLPERSRPRFRPWLWILPALLFVSGYLVIPSLITIWLSVFDARSAEFVGIGNYLQLAASDPFWTAVRNNVLWVFFFTGAAIVFGLIFALLADRVRYESAAKSLVFLPMAISFVAASVIWKFIFDFQPAGFTQTGLLNAVMTTLTAIEPLAWLTNAPWNTFLLILIGVWVWTGFAMIVLSAALKGVPGELLEAARVDGANELQVFRRIVLPLLAPTIAVIATTLAIFALKAFDIIYVTTSGNFETEVLAFLMYDELFTASHAGRSSAIAVILLLVVIPVLIVNVRRLRFERAVR